MNNLTAELALTATSVAVLAELNNYLMMYATEVFEMLEAFTNMITAG